MTSPSRSDLEDAARRFFDELAREDDQPRSFDPDSLEYHLAFNIEASRDRTRTLEDDLKLNKFDGPVTHRAGTIASLCGVAFQDLSDAEKMLTLQLAARAELEREHLFIHRLTSPASSFQHHDDLFTVAPLREHAATARPMPVSPSGKRYPTLAMVIDDFKARMERQGLGDSHKDEVGRLFGWLQEEIHPDSSMDQISVDQVREFRDNIRRMDRNRQGRSSSFRRRLTDIPERQLAHATVQKYWSATQQLFAWAKSEGKSPGDPSEGLKLDQRKGEVRRSPEPFSLAELKLFYGTPLYVGYKSSTRLSDPGFCHERNQHWWAGVLPLFTGLRAGELTQLMASDFSFADAIPHLLVQEMDGDGERTKSVKTASSVRAVPLAAILLDLGLKQFVERRAKIQPKARVFEKFRLGTRGKISEGMTRFWGRYLRQHGLHKPGRSTHVWRHTVIEGLRAAEVAAEDISAVVGHSQGTQTSRYGNGDYPLPRKLKAVERLDYGLDWFTILGGPYVEAIHKA